MLYVHLGSSGEGGSLYSKVFSLKDAGRLSLHYKTSPGTMARKGRRANYAMALKGFLLEVTLIAYIKFYWLKQITRPLLTSRGQGSIVLPCA